MKLSDLFLPFLTLALLGLKLTGTVNIPWIWVFAPLWGPFALAAGLVALCLGIFVLVVIVALVVGLLFDL